MFIGTDNVIRTVLSQHELVEFADVYPPKKKSNKR